MSWTVYDEPIGYNEPIPYNGNSNCPSYDDPIGYDSSFLYDGDCGTIPPAPPPIGNPRGGGTIINVYTRIDPTARKRKREDDEILILGRKRV